MQGSFLAFFVPLSKSIFPSDVIFLLPEGFPLTFLEGMSNDDKCFQQFCLKTSSFYLNFRSYFHWVKNFRLKPNQQKENTDKLEFIKIKKKLCIKGHYLTNNKTTHSWEIIFVSHISNECIVSKIHKGLLQCNI